MMTISLACVYLVIDGWWTDTAEELVSRANRDARSEGSRWSNYNWTWCDFYMLISRYEIQVKPMWIINVMFTMQYVMQCESDSCRGIFSRSQMRWTIEWLNEQKLMNKIKYIGKNERTMDGWMSEWIYPGVQNQWEIVRRSEEDEERSSIGKNIYIYVLSLRMQ